MNLICVSGKEMQMQTEGLSSMSLYPVMWQDWDF